MLENMKFYDSFPQKSYAVLATSPGLSCCNGERLFLLRFCEALHMA